MRPRTSKFARLAEGADLSRPRRLELRVTPSSPKNRHCERKTVSCYKASDTLDRRKDTAILAAVVFSFQMLWSPQHYLAFELGQVTDAAEGFSRAVEEKLQALPFTPNKEPENLFNRILQPGLQPASPVDKQKEEQRAREREEQKAREREYKQREREEKERKERIRREQERIRQERERLFRQQALLGGSALGLGALFIGKWQAIAAGSAILFRTLGGPTIMSNVLRTPGLLFGRSLRVVEWDVARSPQIPNGKVVSFKLRALTPVGLRQAIVRNCGLSDGREVKQMCHWIQSGPGFCEPLTSVPAFRMLSDPSWIVWSRKPRKGLDAIPYRLDEHALTVREQNPFGTLLPQQELELMVRTINAAAALTRGEDPPPIQRQYISAESKSSGETADPRTDSAGVSENGSLGADHRLLPRPVQLDSSSENGGRASRSVNGKATQSTPESTASTGDGLTAENVGSMAENSNCEEAEKEVNQAAMAKTRRLERQRSRSRRRQAVASTGRALADMGVITALRRPMQRISRYIGEAVADPVAATRDAIGMPTQECRPSTLDVYRGHVPGPSMGGQGAEFRETPAQLDRYEAAALAMEELLRGKTFSEGFPAISLEEEERLVSSAVATSSGGLQQLFRIYASDSIEAFLRFSRAFVATNK